MAEHRRALGAAPRPVAAGAVLADAEGGAVGLRPGEEIVPVRRVAAAVDDLALLRGAALKLTFSFAAACYDSLPIEATTAVPRAQRATARSAASIRNA